MEINCTQQELSLLHKIARAAEKMGVETFLVGGFVRDKILGRATTDADIVCVGDGIALAQAVANEFPAKPSVSVFRNFGTAHIKVELLPGVLFDIEFVG